MFKEFTARRLDDKVLFIEHKLRERTKYPQNELQTLSRDLRHFKSDFKKKWTLFNYIEERFFTKNEEWLNSSVSIHTWTSRVKAGRPSKEFRELSDRSKRRKTEELREQVPVDELTYAASVSQRTSGNAAASKIIKDVIALPTTAKKFRKAIDAQQSKTAKKYTPKEALSLFVEGDFTWKQWELLHDSSKSIYPCYTLIREAKKDCYPKQEAMRVTETSAEVCLLTRPHRFKTLPLP
ncbi:unnamed protein product [Psylliodes chrysocephalus]|uniref:Uncharacterized protein n=1 Tax=Psylliodes chrysocephalus TaxID=3402493 RepID=A0A9P0GLK8_9CUCU|nr:unnamed protein product [Psylliodes chrysocephala]